MTAWNKVNALWAGAGVTTRSEETQVGAGSLTGVLNCKHRKIAWLRVVKVAKAGKVSETETKLFADFSALDVSKLQ